MLIAYEIMSCIAGGYVYDRYRYRRQLGIRV